MIYDTEVQFIQKVNSHYDPVLGEYVEEIPQINAYLANVTDLGLERSQKLFGEVKQGRKVIRLLPFQTFPDLIDLLIPLNAVLIITLVLSKC